MSFARRKTLPPARRFLSTSGYQDRHELTDMRLSYLRILQQDKHFVAVSKPPHTICQDERGYGTGLLTVMRERLPDLFEPKSAPFHGPKGVHRLDKPVTGCTLFGLSVHGTRQLSKAFRKREVVKGYLALLSPRPEGIESPLESHLSGVIQDDGRQTAWHVLGRLQHQGKGVPSPKLYLVWLQPREGRYHQLRIHAAVDLHAPVLFDDDTCRYVLGADKNDADDGTAPGKTVETNSTASKDTRKNQGTARDWGLRRGVVDGIALHCASMTFSMGLERHTIKCEPPPYGLWSKIGRLFDIDWREVVEAGPLYRHVSRADRRGAARLEKRHERRQAQQEISTRSGGPKKSSEKAVDAWNLNQWRQTSHEDKT